MDSIILNNKLIISYFKKHPELNPEVVFMFFVEFLERMDETGKQYANMMINQQLIDNLSENNRMLSTINENICKTNQDIVNVLYLKMIEVKKEYMEEMKNALGYNIGNITMAIERNYTKVIEKTAAVLNDLTPKTNQHLQSFINDKFNAFQISMKDELKHVSNLIDTDDNKIRKYMDSIENQFSNLIQTIHQPIKVDISNLQALTTTNIHEQGKLFNEMSDFMKRYKISSYKGSHGETRLSIILNTLFPSGEIIQTTGQKASGDFILKRVDKPTIMFENKDYADNVSLDEVRKFVRDAETLKTHSIFLSHHSGIATKSNYQIEHNNGIFLIYIHHVNYSPEKIQIAIDIIDNLERHGRNVDTTTSYTVQKDFLDGINREYQQYAITKDNLIGSIQDGYKRQLMLIDELQLPSLEKYLSLYYATTAVSTKLNYQYKCENCNDYVCQTKKSLSAHQRACKPEKKEKIVVPQPQNIPPPPSIFINTNKK